MNYNCIAKRNDIEENKQIRTSENAGFSLVEVMLAMAILAILTISLLNYFGTSLAYNTKMASNQKATLLAQKVAEDLKGHGTLIQSRTESQPDGSSRDVYTIPYLLSKGYQINENNLDTAGSGNISFNGNAGNIGENYDVTVEVSSTENAWDKTKKMYGFDNTNSILSVDENQDEDALLEFKSVYSTYCDKYEEEKSVTISNKLTDAQIKEKIKRNIDIEISKDASDYKVNVKYVYTATGLDPDNSLSSDVREYNILSDTKISELKKMFILYHVFNQDDYMTINNTTTDINIPDTLYLVAQKKTDADSLPAGYKMNITGLNMVNLYSNVGTGGNINSSQILENGAVVSNVKKLSEDDFADVHTIDFKVAVYEKGKAGVTGAKPYITIDGTKVEEPYTVDVTEGDMP